MSMEARFLQVEPELLERLGTEDGLVERLFAAELPRAFDPEKMRAAILERGPQLLGGTLEHMPPQLREQIEGAVGRTHQALQRGDGGDALFELLKQRLAGPGGAAPAGRHGSLSLEKAWHGVHYVLTGTVEPDGSVLGGAVLGGTEVGDDFSGYGPARCFGVAEVAKLAAALADPAVEREAAERFDASAMTAAQIYPFGWPDGSRDWVLDALARLRDFYADAAANRWGVVTCLT